MNKGIIENLNPIVGEDIEKVLSSGLDWEKFSGKSVLITGANGFLPAYLVYTLLALNDRKNLKIRVYALVRNKERAIKRFGQILDREDLFLIVQDVCEPLKMEGSIDFIIHAASQASPKYYGVDPVGTLNANVLGTNNLLQFAAIKKIEKFLFFSSSEIYGIMPPDKIPTVENDYGYIDPTNVRACYSEGKRLGETMCVSWMQQYHVPVAIVRPFHTYGPGMDLTDGRVFADFVSDIVNNRDIIMKSDGTAIRAYCYLSDATIAFFLVLLKGKNGDAYNVGNLNCEISVLDLAEKMVNLFPERKLKVVKKENKNPGYIQSFVHRVVPDMKKIVNLGWNPVITIEEGFSRTVKSFL